MHKALTNDFLHKKLNFHIFIQLEKSVCRSNARTHFEAVFFCCWKWEIQIMLSFMLIQSDIRIVLKQTDFLIFFYSGTSTFCLNLTFKWSHFVCEICDKIQIIHWNNRRLVWQQTQSFEFKFDNCSSINLHKSRSCVMIYLPNCQQSDGL